MGYIENLDNAMKSQKRKYNSKMKLMDYHYILSVLLEEFKSMQGPDNGFKFQLTLRGTVHKVTFKLAVQNIMGDCMGMDKLCLFYGSNSLETSRMCRDCDVPPLLSDNPEYKCKYTKMSELLGLSKEQMKCMSIHQLTNALNEIYFGARGMCVYQCTPGEPLHAILLGLIKYLYEEFERDIPKSTLRLIGEIVKYYYSQFSRQSSRGMPSLAPFQNGVDNCDILGGKEQFARLFSIFLAMHNREVIHSLCTQKRHRYDEKEKRSVQIDPMSLQDAISWFTLIESTLITYQWIMSPKHDKADVTPPNENEDSIGQKKIRKFMHLYRAKVGGRKGHGVKLLKFHQLLHYTKQICKDGSIQNIDTGRCESIAVTMYKRIAIWTQRRQQTLTQQLAWRHHECVTAEEFARTLSKHSLSNHLLTGKKSSEINDGLSGSTFIITLGDSINAEYSYHNKTINIDWKGVPVDASYHSIVFKNLTKRLFLNIEDGGCLTHDSVVIGKTEYIHKDGDIFRAHPNFRGFGKWYDWCTIKWTTDADPIPAKIIMFLDLSETEIMDVESHQQLREEMHDEFDEMTNTPRNRRNQNREMIRYLNKGKWVVVRSALSCDDSNQIQSNLNSYQKKYTVDSKITHRVLLEEECRIVPVDSISGTCYAIPATYARSVEECNEFFIVDELSQWSEQFLNN